jgi:hypothetical protein
MEIVTGVEVSTGGQSSGLAAIKGPVVVAPEAAAVADAAGADAAGAAGGADGETVVPLEQAAMMSATESDGSSDARRRISGPPPWSSVMAPHRGKL